MLPTHWPGRGWVDLPTYPSVNADPVAPLGMDSVSIWFSPRLLGTLHLPPMTTPKHPSHAAKIAAGLMPESLLRGLEQARKGEFVEPPDLDEAEKLAARIPD